MLRGIGHSVRGFSRQATGSRSLRVIAVGIAAFVVVATGPMSCPPNRPRQAIRAVHFTIPATVSFSSFGDS
ncbi:MAG: hypothetical protein EA381_19485 [Planctomycetaceae bacterium]|nr:MAG: hypothetical protein EA381_19485 [Planctomycetaceae bacterium]